MKFAIFIPARNVGKTLEKVILRIPVEVRRAAGEILIVDNASSDNTPEVAAALADKVTYLRNEQNQGYGGSQKEAYQYLIEKDFDAVVMVHGDGQYAPELAGDLIALLKAENAAMVFGSRMTGSPLAGGMPFYRYLANIALTRAGNFFLGTRLSEFHSGYRAYRLRALEDAKFNSCSDDYHFDTEIIVNLTERNHLITEMTIPTHYGEESGSISFSHSLWYGVNVLRAVILSRFRRITGGIFRT